MTSYYIDFENVRLSGLKGIENLDKKDQVFIYCREMDIEKIRTALIKMDYKASVKCRIVNCNSKNALDFELISDLFMSRKTGLKVIISKDKGFEAAVQRGLRNGVLCFRREYIGEIGALEFWKYYKEANKEYVLH